VDADRLCMHELASPPTIGCTLPGDCTEDGGAMFVGLGSSCFEAVPDEWEECVPWRDNFPTCGAANGGAGGAGEGGGAGH
jgi:hypothetical protein